MNIAKIRESKVLEEGERVGIIFQGKEITNFEYMRTSRKLVTALGTGSSSRCPIVSRSSSLSGPS
jgi:hypothetical protein